MASLKSDHKPSILEMEKILKSSWFYVFCFSVLTFVCFFQFFMSDGKMLLSSDQMGGFDSKIFLKNSIEQYHQFPMWFSSRLSGMPTIDALFGDPFYLPSIIINSLFPIYSAISIKMIFHVFIAGVFFFLLLRKGFNAHPLIAFTGGVFYMLNPQFFSHIYPGHDGKMYVIAWVPFLIWRMKELVETPKLINVALLSLGLCMSLLTAHIQMNYFVLWGLFFYWTVATVTLFFVDRNNKKGIKLSFCFWSSIVIGMSIALIQLLPSYMYVREAFSVRGVDRGFDFAASWALNWPEAFSLWVPEFVNTLDYYWGANPFKLNSEYTGFLSLFIAVLAIVHKPNKWRIFWGAFALFTFLYAMGAKTPVFYITYYLVPGVNKFRAASMIMFWFSFAAVLLTSLFFKDMYEGKLSALPEKRMAKWFKGLIITNVSFLVITIIFSNKIIVSNLFQTVIASSGKSQVFDINFTRYFVPSLWLWLFFSSFTIAMLIAVIKGKLSPKIAIALLLLIGIIDMYRIDNKFLKIVDPKPYLYSDPVLKKLRTEMDIAPFRCFTLPGALPQNNEGVHGLEGVGGFHDNELKWYREFRGEQDRNYFTNLIGYDKNNQPYLKSEELEKGNSFLDLANVKYLLVRSGNQLLALQNKNALGRISFTQNYVVLDSNKTLKALVNKDYDYSNIVALQREPVKKPNVQPSDSIFSSEWEKYTPNYRSVKVKVPSDGFLRISEVFYPGWEIYVDKKKVPFYQADLTWMAIDITQGNHVIEMMPNSIFLKKVMWISIVTAAILLCYLITFAFFNMKRHLTNN